jgi:hypothetical protein
MTSYRETLSKRGMSGSSNPMYVEAEAAKARLIARCVRPAALGRRAWPFAQIRVMCPFHWRHKG